MAARRTFGALLVILLLAGSALAQTATSTSTATRTPTITATVTLTPTMGEGVCTTDFCAFHYGSFKVDAGTSPAAFTAVIPGLKPGDLIVLYPTQACLVAVNMIQYNTLAYTIACTTDVAEQDVEYVWFARTQNKCAGDSNCQRAATVTPTP